MLQFISDRTNIQFTKMFPFAIFFTMITLSISIGLIVFKGLNLGVDFRGGAEIQVKFAKEINVEDLRDVIEKTGLKASGVQSIGHANENEYLIKIQASGENLNEVTQVLSEHLEKDFAQSGVTIRKTDIVGPKAGENLRISGFQAMAYAILAIMVYLGLRFDFRYAPGAIIALTHDVIIVLGVFSLFQVEFTLQIVAAIMAVIGYSVNDTVIIYDRVREHENRDKSIPLISHMNVAINETLSRTILTSGTTLVVCLSMGIWGGESIEDFFLAMTIGIVVGTYSSVFIASPITLYFDRFKKAKVPTVLAPAKLP